MPPPPLPPSRPPRARPPSAERGGLGLRLSRHSRGLGFGVSLLVLMVYYGLVAVGTSIGRSNDRYSRSAPWLADAAALALGAVLTRRAVLR